MNSIRPSDVVMLAGVVLAVVGLVLEALELAPRTRKALLGVGLMGAGIGGVFSKLAADEADRVGAAAEARAQRAEKRLERIDRGVASAEVLLRQANATCGGKEAVAGISQTLAQVRREAATTKDVNTQGNKTTKKVEETVVTYLAAFELDLPGLVSEGVQQSKRDEPELKELVAQGVAEALKKQPDVESVVQKVVADELKKQPQPDIEALVKKALAEDARSRPDVEAVVKKVLADETKSRLGRDGDGVDAGLNAMPMTQANPTASGEALVGGSR